MNSNFDSCMNDWVKMVNENRFTSEAYVDNPDDYKADNAFIKADE